MALLRQCSEKEWLKHITASRASYDAYYRASVASKYPVIYAEAVKKAEAMFTQTKGLRQDVAKVIKNDPSLLKAMRHACGPTIAPDRLENLAAVSGSFCNCEKSGTLPRDSKQVERVAAIIAEMVSPGVQEAFDSDGAEAAAKMIAAVIADAAFNSWFRNSLEAEQQKKMRAYLASIGGYTDATASYHGVWQLGDIPLKRGEYCFGRAVWYHKNGHHDGKLPIDCIIRPVTKGAPLVFVELKSAGDETNTNKRANEENQKAEKLRKTYPSGGYEYAVVLWGYFGTRYCGTVKSNLHFIWDDDLTHLADLGV